MRLRVFFRFRIETLGKAHGHFARTTLIRLMLLRLNRLNRRFILSFLYESRQGTQECTFRTPIEGGFQFQIFKFVICDLKFEISASKEADVCANVNVLCFANVESAEQDR